MQIYLHTAAPDQEYIINGWDAALGENRSYVSNKPLEFNWNIRTAHVSARHLKWRELYSLINVRGCPFGPYPCGYCSFWGPFPANWPKLAGEKKGRVDLLVWYQVLSWPSLCTGPFVGVLVLLIPFHVTEHRSRADRKAVLETVI